MKTHVTSGEIDPKIYPPRGTAIPNFEAIVSYIQEQDLDCLERIKKCLPRLANEIETEMDKAAKTIVLNRERMRELREAICNIEELVSSVVAINLECTKGEARLNDALTMVKTPADLEPDEWATAQFTISVFPAKIAALLEDAIAPTAAVKAACSKLGVDSSIFLKK